MSRLVYAWVLLAALLGLHCTSEDGCSGSSTEASGEADDASGEAGDESAKANELAAPSDFASKDGDEERARAIFDEMARVLRHPRCVNCHPAGDEPLEGERSRPHQPMVKRGAGGMGSPGMRCNTCHGHDSYRNVPGAPGWRLASEPLGWEGLSTAELCELLTDPEQNGGTSVEEVVAFLADNPLAAYGWDPPEQYEALPGTQERLAALARAWAEAGAHCPEPSASP